MQMWGLPATHPQGNFDAVDQGLQPDKDGPPGPPIRIVPFPATPNLHIKVPQPPSSYPVRGEHHASIANISSKQPLAIQDAPPTSMVSDPTDQNQSLPDYLVEFFLHSPGKVEHVSPNALENLEVLSQEDWACTYPKRLEEAQTESSGLSVHCAASSWMSHALGQICSKISSTHSAASQMEAHSAQRNKCMARKMKVLPLAARTVATGMKHLHRCQRQDRQSRHGLVTGILCSAQQILTTRFHPMGMALQDRM
ncbi:hypothetical protein ABBQ38_006669 [Trebouxia sp. C0009 RCD-2024]